MLITGGYFTEHYGFGPISNAELFDEAPPFLLQNGRFRIDLGVTNPNDGTPTSAAPVKLNEKFGYFWFPRLTNDSKNPEVFVKIVGPLPDGAYLLFYTSLTHVQFTLSVTDTMTNRTRFFEKPQGNFLAVSTNARPASISTRAAGGEGVPLATGTDTFTLFTFPHLTSDPENIELIVKIVGPLPGGQYIVFVGGLTGFEATVKIRADGEYELVKSARDFHAAVLN